MTNVDHCWAPAYPMPAAQFFREVEAQLKEFKRHPRWGGWAFDKKRLVLRNDERPSYEIDVETCSSPEEVLDWLAHVRHRYSPEQLGHLVNALDDLLRFRDNLLFTRSSWKQEIRDVRAHLKKRGWLVRPRPAKQGPVEPKGQSGRRAIRRRVV